MGNEKVRIALIGDYDASVTAHQAIPLALNRVANDEGLSITFDWLPTPEAHDNFALARFDGLWCVPASPYQDTEGALNAIRFAREQQVPFLGTCGGFQHAVIEYARNVLGWADAEHAETSPDAQRAVIAPLSCALVEMADAIELVPGSLIANAYGALNTTQTYRCRFGLNVAFAQALLTGPLTGSGHDQTGDIRVVELAGHPFFVATLFQPERAALVGITPPLVTAFVRACCVRRAGVKSSIKD
ncbi:CTP synthase [Pseudomonas sp. CCI3.2]|uniref:CTP synthase C-terminal region-related (seleno)protein n=2 Tax=Pseudomonas TaxID=286 RepID=UPI002AC8B8EE|nr:MULTISPECIES: CTP synthase [unclassified Pseudomonas]MEB0079151.1 CTP synthase [Pseudomonas sp. MH10out]MEB0092405.1 CTP synthase [Pseudomonas sp. CCI4.2]MEB0102096.1 CTP synthase [Pseudomonas sp. CCI3.2]MEB0132261.1 CTP synthase [Pseudomonas sp. CCI2.4]MEB0168533.1 CTP synthase [Pseudomonas sp. CCC4.4]